MEALVTALKAAISSEQMFTNLTALIPVIGGIILFAFTYNIVKKMITGASKGKSKSLILLF